MKSKLLFFFIALTFIIGGCDKDDTGPKKPTIVGKWKPISYRLLTTELATSKDTSGVWPFLDDLYLDFKADNNLIFTHIDSVTGKTKYTATGTYTIQGNKIDLNNFINSFRYFESDAYYIDSLTNNRLVFRDTVYHVDSTYRTIKITTSIK